MLELILPDNVPAEVQVDDWQQLFRAWVKDFNQAEAGSVAISFVDRAEMKALVTQHTDKTEATDVLSFRYDPPLKDESGAEVIGEIAICPAVAEDFATQHRLTLRDEYATLFVHGLIHLTGRDHADPEDQRRFQADTRAIMEQGGYQTVSLWLD